ncbi:hypothetical protein [Paenibacillus alkalitolerans]|uniref:hypothetical protein n=1 Tax=Paenibacillus alkalitolerans TaxID=2799335 RepID=UPI0018F6B8F9|nr:hypothetical protein [Paenibacillus alkalitolerans]
MLNYTLGNIKIKSNWFDEKGKYQKFGYKGFFLYLSLFRFRLHNQNEAYTFSTSLKELRQVTGYSKEDVLELILKLKKSKVIDFLNITNISSQLLHDPAYDHKHLLIAAKDRPNLRIEVVEKNGKQTKKELPVTNDDYYINISTSLLEHMRSIGLNERHFAFLALLIKLSRGSENKATMKINKMADLLMMGDNNLNKMIRDLNRNHLLYTRARTSNTRKNEKKFEHVPCTSMKDFEQSFTNPECWLYEEIEKNIARWDKKKLKYEKLLKTEDAADVDNDDLVVEEVPEEFEEISYIPLEDDDFAA